MANSVDAKLLRQTKFPPEFNQKVDMKKVNVEVMKKWIAGKISEILGSEDDVVIELCFNLLEGDRYPDIKRLQIQLTGFLDKDTAKFCKDLWALCLSAQSSPQGVPKELLEAKKQELLQEKIDAETASKAARVRGHNDRARERDLNSLRYRERAERDSRGSGSYNSSRRHNQSQNDDYSSSWHPRRAQNRSPSPPPRNADTYVPRERGRRSHNERQRHGSSRSPYRRRRTSSSRSPPRRKRSYSSSSGHRSSAPRSMQKRRDLSRSLSPSSSSSDRRHRTSRSRSPPRKRRVRDESRESGKRQRRRSRESSTSAVSTTSGGDT